MVGRLHHSHSLLATRQSPFAHNSEAFMTDAVKVGIVGLGRWAKVLTQASQKSDKLRIVSGYSRSEEKRAAFQPELGAPGAVALRTMLPDPEIKGAILTVPNEQHLPVAIEVARAGKHVYTEKPLASTLAEGFTRELG